MPPRIPHPLTAITMLTAMLIASSTLAAGGGGGGSGGGSGSGGSFVGSCENDTWYCGDWSACSPERQQTRQCRIVVDCPNIESPKPAETTTCVPPCASDSWECSEWSGCGPDGRQVRTCTLTENCPGVETLPPPETQSCTPPPPAPIPSPTPKPTPRPTPKPSPRLSPTPALSPVHIELLCSDLPTLQERVRCRLALPEVELERQQKMQYLPEECRTIGDSAVRDQCVELYRKLQVCWEFPVGPDRIGCVKKIIKLGDVATEVTACNRLPKNEIADCSITLRSKVWSLIKFRFYDLEERAEELLERGAPLDAVANFVAAQEAAKERFNLATTKEQRRAIILEVRAAWRQFVQTVSTTLK